MNRWAALSRFFGRPVLLALLSLSVVVPAQADNKPAAEPELVAGYIENAWFKNSTIAFQAKLDTGANSSSINAPGYKPFDRDGKKWVRIDITNQAAEKLVFEVPIDSYVTIRRVGVLQQECTI